VGEAHDSGARRRPFWLRRRRAIAIAVVGALAAIAVGSLLLGSDDAPVTDAFYEQPDPLPDGPPGTILRSQAISRPPDGSKAFRILYLSRSAGTGRPAALSALLFVPIRPAPATGRNVVALTHGTVGVAQNCAVSSGRSFFAHVDGLARFMRAGYAVVLPDYEGLGTRGPHPYLVGAATAHATLDAVRATRLFKPAEASARFIAWGVGQGGHAALFTGEEADTYAPELELAGVAAGAPATDLRRLLWANNDTAFGRVLAAYTLATWSHIYPQLRLDRMLSRPARDVVAQVATLCLPADHDSLKAALGDQTVQLTYSSRQPWDTQPWKRLLERNSPGTTAIPVPVIITQGADDRVVRPALTARFVRRLCRLGSTVQYRPSRGVAHVDLGEKTAPYVSKWIVGRFAGRSARSSC
jgi:alpha-beta hydrolase superfamily lysophospholipase